MGLVTPVGGIATFTKSIRSYGSAAPTLSDLYIKQRNGVDLGAAERPAWLAATRTTRQEAGGPTGQIHWADFAVTVDEGQMGAYEWLQIALVAEADGVSSTFVFPYVKDRIDVLDLPSPLAWYDATQEVYAHGADATTITDQSGNGRSVSVSSSYFDLSHILLQASRAYRFTGTAFPGSTLASIGPVVPTDAGQDWVVGGVVGSPDAANANKTLFSQGGMCVRYYNTSLILHTGSEDLTHTNSSRLDILGAQYLELHKEGTTLRLYQGGELVIEKTGFTGGAPDADFVPFTSVDTAVDSYGETYWGELFVLGSSLSADQKKALARYIHRKWGVTMAATSIQ